MSQGSGRGQFQFAVDQLLPDHELPDQLLPDHEEPDQLLPDHELPDQLLPFHVPPDQEIPAASRAAMAAESNGLPKMSCSPLRTTPSRVRWSDPRDPSSVPVPVPGATAISSGASRAAENNQRPPGQWAGGR
jgi:hypothetical protein